jgi:hypothetical protein
MKRLIAQLTLAVVGLVGLLALMEATQNRPDNPRPGSTSTVAFTLSTRDFPGGESTAATTLVAVCAATLDGSTVSPPVASGEAQADETWTVRISPALGEHGRKRLEGCLEDVTLDRVIGHVTDVRTSK